MKQDKYTDALIVAAAAHRGQVRKYSGRPYIEHPIRVAGMVYDYLSDDLRYLELAVQIALLHDVVEDTHYSFDLIEQSFGVEVREGVKGMTDCVGRGEAVPVRTNRATRKEMDRKFLAKQPPLVRAIKMMDIMDNLNDMDTEDPFFRIMVGEVSVLGLDLMSLMDQYGLGRLATDFNAEVVNAISICCS